MTKRQLYTFGLLFDIRLLNLKYCLTLKIYYYDTSKISKSVTKFI